MGKNFKALGLAIVAMLAFGALSAASASASLGELTSTTAGQNEVFGHGTDTGEADAFHAFENTVECSSETFTVGRVMTIKETEENSGKHKILVLPAKAATVTPHYSGCTMAGQPTTVTMNGCDYEFTFGDGKVHLKCPEGKVVEIHRYADHENHTAGKSNCTTTVLPGTYSSVTYENQEDGDVVANGTVGGIKAQSHGACSLGLTLNSETAVYTLKGDEINATNAAGEDVKVHVQ